MVEFIRTRKISTSYLVARWAITTPATNSKIPPSRECISEKTAPPEMSATRPAKTWQIENDEVRRCIDQDPHEIIFKCTDRIRAVLHNHHRHNRTIEVESWKCGVERETGVTVTEVIVGAPGMGEQRGRRRVPNSRRNSRRRGVRKYDGPGEITAKQTIQPRARTPKTGVKVTGEVDMNGGRRRVC